MTEEARNIMEALRDIPANKMHVSPNYMYKRMNEAADLIESLSAQLDAAVRDMGMTAHCDICAHHRNNGGNCIGVSMCGQRRPRWQWRGVKEVE